MTLRLTPAELRRAAEAATVNQQTLSAFIRDAILEATDDCLESSFPTDEHQPRCLP